ncbi:MAG: hypothetical protein AVDCRST_MAG05-4416 [uncultured Rubrobacteraceae bacterium]|uniref:BON domain-containing protein n=1 Tax=uncultured Rubrobacteraceae bacterium TaxID=349277 RepID=A0A6J4TTB3_9ACTN|nr:MAG: hypothetical protein AVDCRST_MAG05-4416 [uncultured Rubrobacteraceae bacterium]
MPKKRTGAKLGARAGSRVAPKAGKVALRAAKSQAKLARAAASPKEPALSRFFKYGLFALAGLAIGSILARSKGEGDSSSSFTGTTGQHTPDAASPAGQRGETWGSGTPTGSAGGSGSVASEPAAPQRPDEPHRTGAEREYSDPSAGPLIGEHHGSVAGVGESQPEAEQRIRTLIGEDPRTAAMPRVNVEVIGGVAELRGPAPSQEAREAAGEIAAGVEGVTEVRNLIVVS